MPVSFFCVCGKKLKAQKALYGQKIKCPSCKGPLVVPIVEPDEPDPIEIVAEPYTDPGTVAPIGSSLVASQAFDPYDLTGAGILPTHGHAIESKYDKFHDRTQLSVDLDKTVVRNDSQELIIKAQFYESFSGKTRVKFADSIHLLLVVGVPSWQPKPNKSDQEIDLLADDFRLSVEPVSSTSSTSSGFRHEYVSFRIPLDAFLQIARARTIEGRYYFNEFAFLDSQVLATKDFARRLAPAGYRP